MTKVSEPSRLLHRELRGSDQGLYHCDHSIVFHSPRQVKSGIHTIRNRHLQEDVMCNQGPLWDVAGVGERRKWKVNPREQVVCLIQFHGIPNQVVFFFPWHDSLALGCPQCREGQWLFHNPRGGHNSFPTTYTTSKISTKVWLQAIAPDRNIRRPEAVHLSFQLPQIILIAV